MSKEINDLKQQIMWLQNRNAFLTNRQEALRDHFAGMDMQGILANAKDLYWDYEKLALTSYEQADAMLAEREKRND